MIVRCSGENEPHLAHTPSEVLVNLANHLSIQVVGRYDFRRPDREAILPNTFGFAIRRPIRTGNKTQRPAIVRSGDLKGCIRSVDSTKAVRLNMRPELRMSLTPTPLCLAPPKHCFSSGVTIEISYSLSGSGAAMTSGDTDITSSSKRPLFYRFSWSASRSEKNRI